MRVDNRICYSPLSWPYLFRSSHTENTPFIRDTWVAQLVKHLTLGFSSGREQGPVTEHCIRLCAQYGVC